MLKPAWVFNPKTKCSKDVKNSVLTAIDIVEEAADKDPDKETSKWLHCNRFEGAELKADELTQLA